MKKETLKHIISGWKNNYERIEKYNENGDESITEKQAKNTWE